MSVHLAFLINSFSSFLFITDQASATDPMWFWPFSCKKLPSVKPKLNSAIVVD